MRPKLIIDNTVDGKPRAKTLVFGQRLVRKGWAAFGMSELLGFITAGTAFIAIALAIFHLMPSEHPTFQDRKMIAGLIVMFGFGMFYFAGRANLFAVPCITCLILMVQALVPIELDGALLIGADIVMFSIVAVCLGGLARMFTPRYEQDL